jgi:hypothetical protein
MTVTPYVDIMCNMDFIQSHSRKDNTLKTECVVKTHDRSETFVL